MSTYAELQQAIAQDLRNRRDLDAIILREAQHRIGYFQTYPFTPQEATDTSISTVIGTATYTLPTSIVEVTGVWFLYGGSNWVPLIKRSVEYLNSIDSVVPAVRSQPELYALYGLQIRLYPTPSLVSTVKITATAKVSAPVNGADQNFWTQDAFDLIRYATVDTIAGQYLHDYELSAQARGRAEQELSNLLSRAVMLRGIGQIQGHWY